MAADSDLIKRKLSNKTTYNTEIELNPLQLNSSVAANDRQQIHTSDAINSKLLDSNQKIDTFHDRANINEENNHSNWISDYCCMSSGDVTIIGAIAIVVNICLGAGLLNFPSTFSFVGGVTGGILIQLVFIPFISSTHLILAHCVDQGKTHYTYQGAVLSVLGTKSKTASEILLVLFCFSTCIAYLVIIGDQFDEIIVDLSGQTGRWYTDRKFVISIISTIFILPLSLIKDIGRLRYSSILGTVAVINVAITVMIEFYIKDYHLKPIFHRPILDWTQVVNAFPTICFGFHCHISSIPSYGKLKNRSIKRFSVVVMVSMLICILIYSITGSFGFMSFGRSVKSDILLNYDSSDVLITIARIMISINMVTSYPVLHNCSRQAIEDLWINFRNLSIEDTEKYRRRRYIVLTLSWFGLTLCLSLFIPNIGDIIALAGGLAAIFIFVFPGFCLIGLRFNYSKKLYFACICYGSFLAVLGVFLFGMATTKGIYDFIS